LQLDRYGIRRTTSEKAYLYDPQDSKGLIRSDQKKYPYVIHKIFGLTEEDLLEESTEYPLGKKECSILTIMGQIGCKQYQIVLDTASEVNILSWENLQQIQTELKDPIYTLPTTNMEIVGITGKRNTQCKKQVMIPIRFGNCIFEIVFLVFAGINQSIIIGYETLKEWKAIINYNTEEVLLQKEKSNIVLKFFECLHDKTPALKNNFQQCMITTSGYKQSDELDLAWENKIAEINKFEDRDKNITGIEKDRLIGIYNKYRKVFSNNPGCAKGFICKLQIKPNSKFTRHEYPVPQKYKDQVNEQINEMLDKGIIEVSKSDYVCPLVVIPKQDGSVRVCLDCREVNKIIVNEFNAPEGINELIRRFDGVKYFSSFDATAGYWQVSLHPDSRKYVSFIFGGRCYSFKRLPFGLINSASIFIRCLDQILGPQIRQFITIYIDDILVHSDNWDTHCERIEMLLERLDEHNIKLKPSKSTFITQKTKFLGYILSLDGLEMDPEKIQCILDFPKPKNLKQLQSFLGMTNYYRSFQKNYSELTGRFGHILSKKNKWIWTEEENKVFEEIKSRFLENVMLKHPDYSRKFYMETDASKIAVGAMIYQYNEKEEKKVIAFGSRTLSKTEKNYTITEQELLAVVFAVTKFRTMLLGHEIIVRTDHKAISFFKKCKIGTGRLARWILTLQNYNIEFEYIKGSENTVADVLSRIDPNQGIIEQRKDKSFRVYEILMSGYQLKEILHNLPGKQIADQRIKKIKDKIKQLGTSQLESNYKEIEGVLFQRVDGHTFNWKIITPEEIVEDLIAHYHERYGHIGVKKTVKTLQEHFIIFGIYRKAAKIIRTCELCQKAKSSNIKYEGERQIILAGKPLEKVFIDICGPLPDSRGRYPKRYILILLDCYTKFVRLYTMCKATTKAILKHVCDDYLQNVGKIENIISDHGSQFQSKIWQEILNYYDIRVYKTSLYHPQSNISERGLKEVKRLLRTYCHDKQRDWIKYIEPIEKILNYSTHETTGVSPYQLMLGRRPPRVVEQIINFPESSFGDEDRKVLQKIVDNRIMLGVLDRKNKNKKQQKKIFVYSIGDRVLLKVHKISSRINAIMAKLLLLYEGPFRISDIKGKNIYMLEEINSRKQKGVYNSNQLKPFYE
jgi:hypothetical protein